MDEDRIDIQTPARAGKTATERLLAKSTEDLLKRCGKPLTKTTTPTRCVAHGDKILVISKGIAYLCGGKAPDGRRRVIREEAK